MVSGDAESENTALAEAEQAAMAKAAMEKMMMRKVREERVIVSSYERRRSQASYLPVQQQFDCQTVLQRLKKQVQRVS
jgi:hypothetical protein